MENRNPHELLEEAFEGRSELCTNDLQNLMDEVRALALAGLDIEG